MKQIPTTNVVVHTYFSRCVGIYGHCIEETLQYCDVLQYCRTKIAVLHN
jgi:hypothetical protein